MKKFLALLLLLVLAVGVSQADAQTRRPIKMKPYFMASIYGGIGFPLSDTVNSVNSTRLINNTELNAMPSIGIDLAYHFVPNFAIYGDFTYNFLSVKDEPADQTSSGRSLLEAYVGPRFFFGMANAKVRPFVELGLGMYVTNPGKTEYTGTFARTEEVSGITQFGINGGAGIYANLSDRLNLFARVKYHQILSKSDAKVDVTTSGSNNTVIFPNGTESVGPIDIESAGYLGINLGFGLKF